MSQERIYPIGMPGEKWGEAERAKWRQQQSVKRSYQEEVLGKLETLKAHFDIERYGALSYDSDRYPLYVVKSRNWDATKPTCLITGGVHGYETSGVQGALRFLETKAAEFSAHFNLIVAPCVSPWGYETINRWNPYAVDPNRSFSPTQPAQEAGLLMDYVAGLNLKFTVHIDLHETTDTDNSEFRPAKAARDAVPLKVWHIPDGFYTVDDADNPQDGFQTAVIQAVKKVTHIAADEDGKIIGEPVTQPGVIHYAYSQLGLCGGFTGATYTTTTEVYPNSPQVDGENCIHAQVAAVTGGLTYVKDQFRAD